MELIPLDAEQRKPWDDFCRKSPDAWFWHTTEWLDYNLAYRPELKARSLSFLCREGGRLVALVPLLLTEHERDGRKWKAFTLSGNALPGPALAEGLSQTERDGILDALFAVVDDLAGELGVSYSRFRVDPLRPALLAPKYAPYNHLLRHDFVDCSVNTQLIDLRLSRNELRAGLRRNHLRSIDKARGLFQVRLHSGAGLTNAKFDEYAAMHARAAGRVTRPRVTFDMMRDWIQDGRGLVAEAVDASGRTAGFELYVVYKNASYGLSACNEPEYKHLPVRHLIEWEAMMWLRDQGVEFYEIGEQHFGTLPHDFPEKKNVDISHFKYGFGGATVPSFYGERFHSKAHWEAERRLRDELFAARYPWTRAERGDSARGLLERFERRPEAAAAPERELPPVPPELARLAQKVLRENPESVKKLAQGHPKILHFLVGLVLQEAGRGREPALVRRAVEDAAAGVIAADRET